MPKMLAAQISRPKGPFELVEKEIPIPEAGKVRIKVEACGICHSDSFTKEGLFPGIQYPRVPGHEVAGRIDCSGSGVHDLKVGDRVGIGWNGGYCGHCESCKRGDFTTCKNLLISGISYDGGYQEYMVAPANALAMIPEELSATEAGPLMCAGITTFNALRNSGARPGDLVAILGIGGLGHLAVQIASKMGFHTVAIARGKDKESLAKKLGARRYINSEEEDPADVLQTMGGAKVILATAVNSQAMGAAAGGIGINGKVIVLGLPLEPIQVHPLSLIKTRGSIMGWPSGSPIDSQDTMDFCAGTGIRSMNEVFPLRKVDEAYERMMSGKARFRVVLQMEH